MKYVVIFASGIAVGYFLFAFNKPETDSSIITRTIKQVNTVPVHVRETRYHSPESSTQDPKSVPAKIDIKVEPVYENKITNQLVENKKQDTPQNIEMTSQLLQSIGGAPYLSGNDSRVLLITGRYSGKLQFTESGRTGDVSKVTFDVNPKTTTLSVIDSYDNPNDAYSFSRDTFKVFKSIPGDHNLLMVETSVESHYMVIDLRALPEIKAIAYLSKDPTGKMILTKKVGTQ